MKVKTSELIDTFTFKSVPIGGHFVDRNRQLFQKTSYRCARAGSGPVYQWRLRTFAVPVSSGLTCPYMQQRWSKK